MGILNTGVSALLSAQRSLATTSHNIANVNTPGYSRQRVELTTREPQFIGVGYIGKGVNTAAIERIHNQFLTVQLRTSTSGDSGIKTFHQLVRQMEQILADEQTSLSTSMQQFFNAMQDVADLPSSISTRQVMISEAQSLAARFQFLDDRFSALGDGVRTQLDLDIDGLNSLASMIADMNTRIVSSQGGQPSNDLLDQRDQLILELSELVSVSTVAQGNGAVNVFIGSGQPIVVESTTSTVSITEPYEGHFDLVLTDGITSTPITDNITGGSIGGLLDFQSQTLEPMHNSLGRLAIGLADTINDQHRLGMNMDGEVNQPFFNVGVPVVLTPGAAPNNVTSAIVDPAVLTDSDYQLVFDGGNDYTLTRLSDNQTTAIDTGGASPFTTTAIDGFTLTITAGAAVNDQYIIRPTINGAHDIGVALTEPRKIAAAGPLRASEATNSSGLPTNSGSGEISEVKITSVTGIPIASTITLTFNSAANQFTVSAPPGGTLAYNPATESAGKQFTLAAAGNATFTVTGSPANGDQFVIENNTSADGDNRNMLALTLLQSSQILQNGTATYQDAYGQLVAEIGTAARQSEISSEALGALLEQATEARESLSGVNLDEEAADILRFQQAFQAAAHMITVADKLFQSLMQSVGR